MDGSTTDLAGTPSGSQAHPPAGPARQGRNPPSRSGSMHEDTASAGPTRGGGGEASAASGGQASSQQHLHELGGRPGHINLSGLLGSDQRAHSTPLDHQALPGGQAGTQSQPVSAVSTPVMASMVMPDVDRHNMQGGPYGQSSQQAAAMATDSFLRHQQTGGSLGNDFIGRTLYPSFVPQQPYQNQAGPSMVPQFPTSFYPGSNNTFVSQNITQSSLPANPYGVGQAEFMDEAWTRPMGGGGQPGSRRHSGASMPSGPASASMMYPSPYLVGAQAGVQGQQGMYGRPGMGMTSAFTPHAGQPISAPSTPAQPNSGTDRADGRAVPPRKNSGPAPAPAGQGQTSSRGGLGQRNPYISSYYPESAPSGADQWAQPGAEAERNTGPNSRRSSLDGAQQSDAPEQRATGVKRKKTGDVKAEQSDIDMDGPSKQGGRSRNRSKSPASRRANGSAPQFSYSGSDSRPMPMQRAGSAQGDRADSAHGGATGPDGDAEEKIDHRKRKRNRTIQSCLPCHQNKRKCDRKRPCSRCTALSLTGSCVYEVDHARNPDDPEQTENDHLRFRIAELEQVVRELRQKAPNRSNVPPALPAQPVVQTLDPSIDPSLQDTPGGDPSGSKKRRVIVDRFARFKIDEAQEALRHDQAGSRHDLVHSPGTSPRSHARQVGHDHGGPSNSSSRRTSLSDGYNHGEPSRRSSGERGEEPYRATFLNPGEEIIGDAEGRKAYVGIPGGRDMLRRLANLTESKFSGTSQEGIQLAVPEEAAFRGVFPDMRKTFPFTTIWSHENFSGEIIGLLPSQEQAELLWVSFEEEIAMFFCAWHFPTLKQEYTNFFRLSSADKMTIPLGNLSVYLMISALGIMMRASQKEIFGQAPQGSASLKKEEVDLTCSRLQSELYLSGAYQALRLCSFLSSPTIATLTSQTLIGIYLLNSERASDFWSSLGSLIRQAIAIGLHIDPVKIFPNISPREVEVRRRLWWTIAGLEALLCLSLGRPSSISYYDTELPQDIEDDKLTDAPGVPMPVVPPDSENTSSQSYHTAYFALTIPSLELLERVFNRKRDYARSPSKGWFSMLPDDMESGLTLPRYESTYDDALRLDGDIVAWYKLVPPGMRFEASKDTAETLLRERSRARINQTLALCVKTNMVRLVMHRPYLRLDGSAYPDSTEICLDAAHTILSAYRAMHGTRSSIAWSWWTMSLRAFHAAAVCAFLAIRSPDSPTAERCIEDIRGAISIFEGRVQSWPKAHPVQSQLCDGLLSLEKLATIAFQQSRARERETVKSEPGSSGPAGLVDPSTPDVATNRFGTNLAAIPAFPALAASPAYLPTGGELPHITARPATASSASAAESSAFQHIFPAQSDIYNLDSRGPEGAPDTMMLPQFWAEVFGIPLSQETPGGTMPKFV